MKNTLKRVILGSALLVSMGAANAAMVNINAGNYTFSYNNDYWLVGSSGTTFGSLGNVFTFSDLGYSAVTTAGKKGYSSSEYYDSSLAAISITAKTGYQLMGVTSSASGSLSATAGVISGAYAGAQAFNEANWTNQTSVTSSTGPYAHVYAILGGTDAKNYTVSGTSLFAANTISSSASLISFGYAEAEKFGGKASVSLDSASFSVDVSQVAVSPVPEAGTSSMMLLGLGLMGLIARRRRNNQA